MRASKSIMSDEVMILSFLKLVNGPIQLQLRVIRLYIQLSTCTHLNLVQERTDDRFGCKLLSTLPGSISLLDSCYTSLHGINVGRPCTNESTNHHSGLMHVATPLSAPPLRRSAYIQLHPTTYYIAVNRLLLQYSQLPLEVPPMCVSSWKHFVNNIV